MLLAGDIGGTKTNLAVISVEQGAKKPLVERTYSSKQYESLSDVVADFLAETKFSVEYASFGVAGPVVNGEAEITNLPWLLSEDYLRKNLKLKDVVLLNDLESIARAIPILDESDLYLLKSGTKEDEGNIAVVAPGTGLGEAFLTREIRGYAAHPSEGGHVDFAPRNKLQFDLLEYLQKHFGHVSYERICSGVGIPNIYDFLRESGWAEESIWVKAELKNVKDVTPIIVNAARNKEKECKLCCKTLEVFIEVLGAECGNAALKFLATGGVYLGGGIPPRLIEELNSGTFLSAFMDKGRFADLLAEIPVNVITNPKSALIGAACQGLEQFLSQ